jgi:hypothetical protein
MDQVLFRKTFPFPSSRKQYMKTKSALMDLEIQTLWAGVSIHSADGHIQKTVLNKAEHK